MNKGNERAKKLVQNFKKLGAKEFFKRWGQGIEAISPFQQVKGNLIGMIPMFAGLIWGTISTCGTGYLSLIFTGGIILSIFQLLGFLQKYIRLKIQDKIMKEAKKASATERLSHNREMTFSVA